MNLWKKLCCIALSACLCLCFLAGCTANEDTEDTILRATGVSADTVVMKVNGADITAEVYCYWLSNSITYLDGEAYNYEGVVWTDEQDGVSTKEYVKNEAVETVKLYQVVEENALKNGCKLTEDDKAYLEEMRAYFIESTGGDEEAYLKELQLMGISEQALLHFTEVSQLYEHLFNFLYGEDSGNLPSDEALTEYANEQAKAQGYESLEDFIADTGYLFAKHILLRTVDDNQEKLPENEIAEKKKQAEDLLKQLRESDDPIQLFDELMNQYSEDPGLATNPSGYVFGEGQMYEVFENATKALGDNEISDIIESEAGYHIILRRPSKEIYLTAWGDEQFQKQIETWIAEAQVEYTSAFHKIDPQSFYENMEEIYREGHPDESASPEVSESPALSPSPEASTEGAASPSPEASPETSPASGEDAAQSSEVTPSGTE